MTKRQRHDVVVEQELGGYNWPRVQFFAYDAQIRGVPVNPTEDRVVIDRAAVLAILDRLAAKVAR